MMILGAVLSLSSRALAGARAREEPTQERGHERNLRRSAGTRGTYAGARHDPLVPTLPRGNKGNVREGSRFALGQTVLLRNEILRR